MRNSSENNPETSEVLSSELEENISIEESAEALLPSVPPFFPGLEISEEEFQSPDPIQMKAEEIILETMEAMDVSASETNEEDVEFKNWLNSLGQTPSISIPERNRSGWDDQPADPVVAISPKTNSWKTPAQEANYVMLNTGFQNQGIPLFTDQELWGVQETGNPPRESMKAALAQQIPSVQVLEEEKPKGSTELFKSWRLSDQPEHDPAIWKSMLEALEKKLASEKAEASNSMTAQVSVELPSVRTDW